MQEEAEGEGATKAEVRGETQETRDPLTAFKESVNQMKRRLAMFKVQSRPSTSIQSWIIINMVTSPL